MLKKTWSVICDNCQNGIDHYTGYTKKQALAAAKENGVEVKNNKHFCDIKCLKEFF